MIKITQTILTCAGILLMGSIARADVYGSIQTTSKAVVTGRIRYKSISKVYIIDSEKNGRTVTTELKASDIAQKRITKPKELDAAIRKADTGQHAAAIPILKSIVDDYETLQWDIPAAKSLGECYLAKGNVDDALRVCQKVYKNNRGEDLGQFMRVYWKALLEGKKNTELGKLLDEAIASGDRESAALAQLLRGDMAMKAGRYEEAVIDGYLRTVLLFQDIKTVRAEALYKAYKCFQELGRQQYATKMRQRLVAEFPGDRWTRMLDAG